MMQVEGKSIALVRMAIAAGQAILDIYREGADVIRKGDGSPVTAADHAAEAILLAELGRVFPGVPVVAEEDVAAGHMPLAAASYILVDPLDGTREFISRNGEFTVNIAVIENGVPGAGVVLAPALGEIYWTDGLTAWAGRVRGEEVEGLREIRTRQARPGQLTVLASRSHLCERTTAVIEALKVQDVVSVGSSLKLCWLAEGRADIYPRLSPTMQWDIAAGHAVLRAAGGTVLDLGDGQAGELAYRLTGTPVTASALRNPDFVALGDPGLAAEVLRALE
ncbi:3'(2'),5'-bisphosphate nucleotidase CysQ [Pannonibacter tanglangensis]|nr:3'(2'),5'-bisphosphate nucleotidase CysQ [Pannonibacter sp. XCT-34]